MRLTDAKDEKVNVAAEKPQIEEESDAFE